MYALGIDLGTTYTAAATWRDGRAQILSLGSRGAAIPSVVLLRPDETFLTGEAANRRGLTEPQRVAREFKRRVGDTTPLMLGGTPYSAEALMSQLLRAVVSEVVTREGGPPASVCVSHPANWGPYKIDLLRQAVRMADLRSVSFVTEPEAAAVNYAQEQRLGVGAVVAVYDLGGGTFDAAVLRRTATGFTILGEPEGIERLGGIDFDAAVFNHVRTTLGSELDDLDEDDPAVLAAVSRLREECVQAKEALSADTDTAIPVLLPTVTTEVRLTRGELESMVRPALHGSIEALQRAVRSAGLTPEQVHSVLLVGGSSRMPLVGQLVTAELGRPVSVDTHPKHAVALGAARLAGGGFAAPANPARGRTAGLGAAAGLSSTSSQPGRGSQSTPARPIPGSLPSNGHGSAGPVGGMGAPPPRTGSSGGPATFVGPAGMAEQPGVRGGARTPAPTGGRPGHGPGPGEQSGGGSTQRLTKSGDPGSEKPAVERVGPPPTATSSRRRVLVLAAAVVALVLLAGAGVGLAVLGGNDGAKSSTVPTSTKASSSLPADEQCTDAIMSNPRWVCLTSAIVADGRITIDYRGDGSPLNINGDFHLHVYGGDGANPPAGAMGMQAPAGEQGKWYVEDRHPAVLDVTDERFRTSIGDAPKVCARIADANHHLVPDTNGTYATGNCVPITRTTATTTEPTKDRTTRNRPSTRTTTTSESTTTTTESTTDTSTTTTTEVLAGTPAP